MSDEDFDEEEIEAYDEDELSEDEEDALFSSEELDKLITSEVSDEDEKGELPVFKKLGAYHVRFLNPALQATHIQEPRRCIIRILPDDKRQTSEMIQIPEMTEAIGIRISQIEHGAPCFAKDTTGLTSPIDMARKEFFERQSPLKLQRQLGEKSGISLVEEWKVREMTFPVTQYEISQAISIGDVEKSEKHSSEENSPKKEKIKKSKKGK